MAIRFTFGVRPMLIATALAAAVALVPSVAAEATQARQGPRQNPVSEPSVVTIEKQLGELALQNSQVVEEFNHARVLVGQREAAAGTAQTISAQANATFEQARRTFTQSVQAQYETGSLGAASALLDSNSGPNYIERLTTLNMISTHDADVVRSLQAARQDATRKSTAARDLLDQATQQRDALAAKRGAVDRQILRYQTLLSTLSTSQQAAFARASTHSVANFNALRGALPAPTSAAAKSAVEYALAQLGKPYVFGAAGPSSFDCSGLTLAAWQRGGVSLPHSAADQYNYGTHVQSPADLQPGDLVFLYQPIDHVTIYIGDGLMVSAPTEGQNVTVVPLASYLSDYVGGTHLK